MKKERGYKAKFRITGEENPDVELTPEEIDYRIRYHTLLHSLKKIELGELDIGPYEVVFTPPENPFKKTEIK